MQTGVTRGFDKSVLHSTHPVSLKPKDWPLTCIWQRPRKYANGRKLKKKNGQGILEYTVTIVSAVYDNNLHKWLHTLKDWQGKAIGGMTAETDLG